MSKSLAERRRYYTQLIQTQIESGTPVPIFCKTHNIPQATFYYWRKKVVSNLGEKENSDSPRFIPLSVSSSMVSHEEDRESASLLISFPSGITVNISGKGTLTQSMFTSIFESDKIQ